MGRAFALQSLCVAVFLLISGSRPFLFTPSCFSSVALPAALPVPDSTLPHAQPSPQGETQPGTKRCPLNELSRDRIASAPVPCQHGKAEENREDNRDAAVEKPLVVNSNHIEAPSAESKPCRCPCSKNQSHHSLHACSTVGPAEVKKREAVFKPCSSHASLRRLPDDSEDGLGEDTADGVLLQSRGDTDKEAGKQSAGVPVQNQGSRESRRSNSEQVKEVEQAVLYIPVASVFPLFVTPAQRWSSGRIAAMMGRGTFFALSGFEPLY